MVEEVNEEGGRGSAGWLWLLDVLQSFNMFRVAFAATHSFELLTK